MNKPLLELFDEATGFNRRLHSLRHPCADTCSGYQQGGDEREYAIRIRREPLDQAVREVIIGLEAIRTDALEMQSRGMPMRIEWRTAEVLLEQLRAALEGMVGK